MQSNGQTDLPLSLSASFIQLSWLNQTRGTHPVKSSWATYRRTDRPIDGASLKPLLDVHVFTLVVHHHDLKVVVLRLSIELYQRVVSYRIQRGIRIGYQLRATCTATQWVIHTCSLYKRVHVHVHAHASYMQNPHPIPSYFILKYWESLAPVDNATCNVCIQTCTCILWRLVFSDFNYKSTGETIPVSTRLGLG